MVTVARLAARPLGYGTSLELSKPPAVPSGETRPFRDGRVGASGDVHSKAPEWRKYTPSSSELRQVFYNQIQIVIVHSLETLMSKSGLLDLVAIRNATPFQTVLEHYELSPEKPGTRQAKIHCPFHDDHTPSCSINLERGIYKCFGCPAKGNVLDFIAEMEGITENHAYQAALVALSIIGRDRGDFQKPQERRSGAKKAKTTQTLPAARKTPEKPTQAPQERVQTAPRKKSNDPIDISLVLDHEHPFLQERGVSSETAAAFGIGHCRTGIMKNRIAVPIHNPVGELVAFTGRWADGTLPEKEPRYKLPKGFEKSLELFNLHRATAFKKPYVVVVEGIWSTIRLHEAGIPTVALLGTDVSAAQAELLVEAGFKYAVLLLDGDEAGRLATPAALQVLSQALYVKTVVLPEGSKPDTMDNAIVSRLRR